jgi:hypothetical protein
VLEVLYKVWCRIGHKSVYKKEYLSSFSLYFEKFLKKGEEYLSEKHGKPLGA